MEIKLLCQKDFSVINKTNIVLVDLGCAYGDFLSQLGCFGNITAIGVDPLLSYYTQAVNEGECTHNNLRRYSKLIEACVVPYKKEQATGHNETTLNYYHDMPDVSSIYELSPNITDDTEDKDCFYHYLPNVVELLKSAQHTKVKVATISLVDIIMDYEHIDILKIDIQGPDLDILLELEPHYLDKITMIHIEGPNPMHQQLLYRRPMQTYDDYISFFSKHNFQLVGLYKLDNNMDNYTSDIDYIFIRR